MKSTWVSLHLLAVTRKRALHILSSRSGTRYKGGKQSYCHKQVKKSLLKLWPKLYPHILWLASSYRLHFVMRLRLVCRFFWGQQDSRKIHWVKWQDMCKPKMQGGMGFEDLSMFNDALLANKRVDFSMKHNYFSTGFLKPSSSLILR